MMNAFPLTISDAARACDSAGACAEPTRFQKKLEGLPLINYHLSSCEWGGRSSYVLVEPAAKKITPDFVVSTGDLIRIEIVDAGDRLASEGKSPIGISIPGVFFRRPYRISRAGSVTAHEIAVPRNRAMILRWESPLRASDTKGAAFGLERDLGSALERDGIGQSKISIRID